MAQPRPHHSGEGCHLAAHPDPVPVPPYLTHVGRYVVGYAGWLGTIALFGFSNLVAVLTAFSFSAIVTNGKMGGGGAATSTSFLTISRAFLSSAPPRTHRVPCST